MELFKREPALFVGVILSLLNLLVGLGVLDATSGEAIASVLESVLILVAAGLVRQNVTPVK